MNLKENLNINAISIKSGADSKEAVLREIAALSVKSGLMNKYTGDDIFSLLKEREEHTSTGIGQGLAIPHCHLEDIDSFLIGVVSIAGGIDFDSLDGEKTKLFIFIIAPESQRNKHIQILSAISGLMLEPGKMDAFLQAGSAEEIVALFSGRDSEPGEEQKENRKCMLRIFIQNEEAFTEILNMLSSKAEGEIAVVETENAGSYLYKMPLFSSFWDGENTSFSRIIISVLDKTLCNDAIRRINLIKDRLKLKSGVLITAQELFFASGSLDF